MNRTLKFNDSRKKHTFPVILLLLIIISISFAESRIIIEGNSTIIVESRTKETKILADKIETSTGGKFIDSNYNANSNEDIKTNIEGFPQSFVIEEAYPNPFNPSTNIKYGIEKASDIEIAIFDLTGQLVNSIKIDAQSPGWHEFNWNGTDASNQKVSTGIYLVTMRSGKKIQRQKVTFCK